jgi:hypothetical protein
MVGLIGGTLQRKGRGGGLERIKINFRRSMSRRGKERVRGQGEGGQTHALFGRKLA